MLVSCLPLCPPTYVQERQRGREPDVERQVEDFDALVDAELARIAREEEERRQRAALRSEAGEQHSSDEAGPTKKKGKKKKKHGYRVRQASVLHRGLCSAAAVHRAGHPSSHGLLWHERPPVWLTG